VADGRTVYADPVFNVSSTDVQTVLRLFCLAFYADNVPRAVASHVKACVFHDFAVWVEAPGAAFPMLGRSEQYIAQRLHLFLSLRGRLGEAGFSSANPSDDNFRIRFIKAQLWAGTHEMLFGSPSEILAVADSWERTFKAINDRYFVNVSLLVSSDRFADAASRTQASSSIAWSIGIGAAIMFVLVHVFTCSLTMALISFFTVGGAMLLTLNFYVAFGWTMGAVEQLTMSMLLGLGVEYTIHMQTAFLDTVHTANGQLFAPENTRLASVRGALLRAGLSIVGSAVAVVATSLCFIDSSVTVFRRASEASVLATIVSMVYSIVFAAGALASFGPLKTFRIITIQFTLFLLWAGITAVVIVILSQVRVQRPDGRNAIGG